MRPDLPDAAASSDERAANEEIIRAMAELSPAMLWMGNEKGKCVFLNAALREFWGVSPVQLETFDWASTTHPDDIEKLSVPFQLAMKNQTPFEVEARYLRADGQYRSMLTKANPRFDRQSGRFLGMTGVNIDITDRLLAEAHSQMLMGELNHRTKNLLAVVQAIARQTVKRSTPEEFLGVLNDRVSALAASNDLLLKSDWTGVELHELVQQQIKFLGEALCSRVSASGPNVLISASAAQTLGMAFHELATNSLKHGALSKPAGEVQVTWSLDGLPGSLSIDWREFGAGQVNPPVRKGFGHTVIVDMVSAALDAEVAVAYEEGGFSWHVLARSNLCHRTSGN